MRGLQEVLNRLIGPKSILNDLLSEDGKLTKEIQQVIEDVLSPQRSPDMGQVDSLVRNLVEKVTIEINVL